VQARTGRRGKVMQRVREPGRRSFVAFERADASAVRCRPSRRQMAMHANITRQQTLFSGTESALSRGAARQAGAGTAKGRTAGSEAGRQVAAACAGEARLRQSAKPVEKRRGMHEVSGGHGMVA